MKVYMLWYGGASYEIGDVNTDIEEFDSIKDAVRAFDSRADSWNTYYPMVERTPQEEGGQAAWLFFYDPRTEGQPGDPYPDRILEYGPKGGIHVNRT